MDGSRLIADMAALSAFTRDSQHNRLLRLDFPLHDGPPGAVMLVNSLLAREEISRDFHFKVEVISDDAHIELTSMITRMVTISMVRNDGSLRYFNGYVTQFGLVKADGGFAFYEMILEPWLAFARLRQDLVSFHLRSVIEITEDTFAHYRQRDWKTRLYGDDPKLTCANQYNETDYNHLHRRWEAMGLHYWYEHRADGHTLWLGDNTETADPIDAVAGAANPDEIAFRSAAGSLEDDGIHAWQAVRRIGSGFVTLASFDYKNPGSRIVDSHSLNRQGDVFAYERYAYTGYGYENSRDGEERATRQMQAMDAMTQYFEAKGNDRNAMAGRSFKLGGHFSGELRRTPQGEPPRASISSRDYLILAVEHIASNNYHAGPGAQSHYENKLTCIRKSIRWRPGPDFNSTPCPDPGVQSAIVVGPPGEDIYTDEFGRVKLQFHWDRIGKFDVNSSPWIRPMMPLAGVLRGLPTIHRVKDEVLVQFLGGNVDHPIVTGAVYNNNNMPSWRLPGQRALTGLRTSELSDGGGNGGGVRSNHLILDDTNGKIQAQLKSDHQHSQLSLGHITRIEDNAGRKDARGEGWELASNAWGVARAGKGMLITTEARPNAASHIKSMDETVQRLSAAHGRHKAQAELALEHGAQEGGQQIDVADVVKSQNAEIKGAGGADGAFPELSAPHLVLASPAGIETTTAQSTHIASAEHTAMTTGRNLSIATGDSLFASISQAFRLFVHKAGMKLVAAAGKVTIQAKTDDIEVIANKVLSLISESDWVDIRGKKGVRLHGAGSMVEISDKVQVFTASPTLFYGNLETVAPKNRPQPTIAPSAIPTTEQLFHTVQGHPNGPTYANLPYEIYKAGVLVDEGITDNLGRVVIKHEEGVPAYRIKFPNSEEFTLQVSPRFASENAEQALSNDGIRSLDNTPGGRVYD